MKKEKTLSDQSNLFISDICSVKGQHTKPLAVITWEDITAYSRVELPYDFSDYRLMKKTVGFVWAETDEYIVLVQDYDLSNKGKGHRHNDFHVIPKGVIKNIRYLGEEEI